MRLPAFGLALLLAACTAAGPYPSVPPQRAESIPLPPVSADVLTWQPGHWDWANGSYVWTPGTYVPAAGHGPLWVQEHWDRSGGGWTWVPAHWTGP